MKIGPHMQLREEMKKIIATVRAPDSRPLRIMKANKLNQSDDWNEAGDAERCDANVSATVESFDQAIEDHTKPK